MSHGLMILFSKLKVIVLWNKGQKQVRYDWLPGGWCVNESEEPLTKARLSVMLEDLLSGEGKLRYTSSIPRIYNEHAPVSTLAQTLRTCIYPKCSTNPTPLPLIIPPPSPPQRKIVVLDRYLYKVKSFSTI